MHQQHRSSRALSQYAELLRIPPLYFIHGLEDTPLALKHYLDLFANSLKEARVKDVTYKRFGDAGQGVYVQHIQEARPAREAFLVRTFMNYPFHLEFQSSRSKKRLAHIFHMTPSIRLRESK